ncbi:disulfide bond formation protein D [Streptomyces venezuelae]|uniref:DsbA family protein n=1 Tax=Streptomyces venezuelae TaxID=54571 RepID=UPI00123BD2D0|nr:thioredoxin domain-containing protein [Streptomyces venezuelae]QES07494.1 disulfide bond formation protein D [Streptomyces venezuelae]
MTVRRTRRVVAAAVTAGLIGLAAVGCSDSGGSTAAAVTVAPAAPAEETAVLAGLPAAVDGTKIVVGETKAPHTVTVYVDPRCGYCAKFEASGGTVLAEQAAAGTVKVEYVVASFLDARTGGTASARAANALRAAVDAGTGKFAAFQAALFASQPAGGSKDGFSADHLLRIADQVEGLRSAAFDRAVREDTYRGWVADAEKAFEASGVGGTPTVLVDGAALPGGHALYDAAEFSKALGEAGV